MNKLKDWLEALDLWLNGDDRTLLSDGVIRREYIATHLRRNEVMTFRRLDELIANCPRASDFTVEERRLSLDEFSRRRGWIQ